MLLCVRLYHVAKIKVYRLFITGLNCSIIWRGDFLILWMIESLADPNDKRFIEKIYKDFNRTMFKTAGRYVSSLPDQEDIVQNAIVKLIGRVDDLRKFSCCVLPKYIVYTIRSVAIDFLRTRGRLEAHIVSLDDNMTVESKSEPLDAYLISKERTARSKEIWPKLPEEEQLLLEGKYIWGHSDKELAEDFRCKPDSIRMKLTRARRHALNLMTEREQV